ncbi:hypothetical protein [Allosphingosinicella deserti]|uniref:hypothetical protein n=1 Tax=Allosphingosinicella deserti TaxID=2116704 RepID=UPI0018EC842A|nr:hypothetical protein [Sphingomonas deserti]
MAEAALHIVPQLLIEGRAAAGERMVDAIRDGRRFGLRTIGETLDDRPRITDPGSKRRREHLIGDPIGLDLHRIVRGSDAELSLQCFVVLQTQGLGRAQLELVAERRIQFRRLQQFG